MHAEVSDIAQSCVFLAEDLGEGAFDLSAGAYDTLVSRPVVLLLGLVRVTLEAQLVQDSDK